MGQTSTTRNWTAGFKCFHLPGQAIFGRAVGNDHFCDTTKRPSQRLTLYQDQEGIPKSSTEVSGQTCWKPPKWENKNLDPLGERFLLVSRNKDQPKEPHLRTETPNLLEFKRLKSLKKHPFAAAKGANSKENWMAQVSLC